MMNKYFDFEYDIMIDHPEYCEDIQRMTNLLWRIYRTLQGAEILRMKQSCKKEN